MTQAATIGLLLPNSSILPIGKDFERGVRSGVTNSQEVEYIKEFIGNGGVETTQKAIQKLIGFDDANIIAGVINNRVVAKIADTFEKRNNRLIAGNIGECWPNPPLVNVSTHSLNAWQQVWAMAKWAAKEIGPKGMFACGLYDSGYSFMAAMNEGMLASGIETQLPFVVSPAPGFQDGKIAEVHKVIPSIEKENPDFVFAAFCGEEAKLFLEYFVKSGLSKKIPVLSLPYLLQPAELLSTITIYTTSIIEGSENDINEVSAPGEWKSNYFSLGKKVGREIASMLKQKEEVDRSQSPNITLTQKLKKVLLYEVKYTGEIVESTFKKMEELGTPNESKDIADKFHGRKSGGWNNPYLSI